MNPFCIFGIGCTWEYQTQAPDPRWNTTKDGLTLEATHAGEVQHFRVCRRCGKRESVEPPTREKKPAPPAAEEPSTA